MFIKTARRSAAPALLALSLAATARAQAPVTTPEQFFGHRIGADYVLPDYTQFTQYWQRLDSESDRMTVGSIGPTAEGREQLMAIITSPENHRNLDRYREIAARLARAEGLTDEQARELAREGKAVVWFDGGLHATEVLGAQQLIETVYHLVSRDDPETLRFLDDLVILAVHANPDGMELVSDWYMREPNPQERSTGGIPRLYQKYVGHDNNRDFYMSTQPETENINRVMYHEWFPQIVYNHHQTGPTGTVLFAPPFRDPFNYNIHPLIITSLDGVGAAMHGRFVAEDKPGATMRRGANYSTWWNGGLRTAVYFHNMIGLLTETIGNPTPIEIPFLPNRQLPSADLPAPIEPQKWHFRNSVDYSVTANYAVFDYASRNREHLLLNIYEMGRDAIEAGSRDSWTVYPKRVDAVRAAMEADYTSSGVMNPGGLARNAPDLEESRRYLSMLRAPETRDPRAYVLPADQADFPTAVEFVNALRETGVRVHRATRDFAVNGRSYPAGSFVVRTAQAFRPHVLDMFEPQDHPNDFLYPGGPPIPPYDASGWTLAYQMGVEFDRILDGFEAPLEEVTEWNVTPPAGTVEGGNAAGFLLSPRYVEAYAAAVELIEGGERVYRLGAAWRDGSESFEPGTYYIPAGSGTRAKLERIAREDGLDFEAASARPNVAAERLSTPRIALWDQYGGSMPSGWTRWILEQQGIPFEVVYPQQLDAGDLARKYDVIVFVDGAIPEPGERPRGRAPDPEEIPAEFRGRLGSVTAERTVPELREFLEAGGTVVTIGSSTALAQHLGLPVRNHLEGLSREQYYIPGSVLRVRMDNAQPVAFGLDEQVDVFFDNSPVFALESGAEARGVRRIAWFDTTEPLRSGWAWGQERLQGGAAAVQADVGEGTLYLFGPEILYRAQPHGTFKLFFNALAESAAEEQRIR